MKSISSGSRKDTINLFPSLSLRSQPIKKETTSKTKGLKALLSVESGLLQSSDRLKVKVEDIRRSIAPLSNSQVGRGDSNYAFERAKMPLEESKINAFTAMDMK